MKKRVGDKMVIFFIAAAVMIMALLFPFFQKTARVKKYKELKEYSRYTTADGRYSVVLKDNTEPGLIGAVRLNVYLVDNGSDKIKYIGEQRMDQYDDFTPYAEYSETDGKVVVQFHLKHSDEEMEVLY